MEFWLTQAFNGISYGALLFLLGSGLSLVFGVMRIVNLAHGSYFRLGGYVGLTAVSSTQSLPQVLMTMGFALVFQDLGLLVWGGDPHTLAVPALLAQSVQAGPVFVSFYRLFIIAVASAVGLVLWVFLEKTRAGASIRATVDDAEMAQGVGINVPLLSAGVFALGVFLAALGGVVGAGFIGVYPGLDFEVLPYAFVVVLVGGLGSLPGVIVGSLLVGLLDNFGKALFPELSYFTLFAPMALILALKPTGLFGKR